MFDWQVFKSNNCIENTHIGCALGFMCQCGCHFPPIVLTDVADLVDSTDVRANNNAPSKLAQKGSYED